MARTAEVVTYLALIEEMIKAFEDPTVPEAERKRAGKALRTSFEALASRCEDLNFAASAVLQEIRRVKDGVRGVVAGLREGFVACDECNAEIATGEFDAVVLLTDLVGKAPEDTDEVPTVTIAPETTK